MEHIHSSAKSAKSANNKNLKSKLLAELVRLRVSFKQSSSFILMKNQSLTLFLSYALVYKNIPPFRWGDYFTLATLSLRQAVHFL